MRQPPIMGWMLPGLAGQETAEILADIKDLPSRLNTFLVSGNVLKLQMEHPQVTIVVVTYGRPELVLECLHRTAAQDVPCETVIVDNGSGDRMGELLSRVQCKSIIRADTNEGFPWGANRGAALGTTPTLLFLNPDAFICSGAVSAALRALSEPNVGAVGGKMLDGRGWLQEAGCRFTPAGRPEPIGRGEDPSRHMRRVRVDYCSGCFLMTPAALFRELGGFDLVYTPGYFEDCDYCLRLAETGRDVVYAPDAVAIHLEGSSTSREIRDDLMARNWPLFFARNQKRLQNLSKS
jgi:GT2 family glycosyltransferase